MQVKMQSNTQKLNRPMLTIALIFGSAFLLAAMGCAGSNSDKPAAVNAQTNTGEANNNEADQVITELSPAQITRECSDAEFSQLINWRNLLNTANEAVANVNGKKDPAAIKSAVSAVQACDSLVEHHKSEPCRRTKKTIVGTDVKYYDQYRLIKDCKKSTDYLVKYDARPIKNAEPIIAAPTPSPSPENPPVATQPDKGNQHSEGSLRQCTNDEFARLSDYSSLQSKADTAIKALGSVSNWSYNANAISSAALAAKSCENLIKYHAQNPCEKTIQGMTKQYTDSTLRGRCEMARTYFYEFVQNTNTLIFPGANLYLDFSPLSPKIFEPGFNNQVSGNCIVENRTENTIDYSNHQALIVETRGFADKMLVMQTAEGLLIQCYGLNIDGPFSKREIVKVLREEQSDIRLTYVLK